MRARASLVLLSLLAAPARAEDATAARRAEDAAARAEAAAQRSEAAAARTEHAVERIERLLDAMAAERGRRTRPPRRAQ